MIEKLPGTFKIDEQTKEVVRIQPKKHNISDLGKLKGVLARLPFIKRETELLKKLRKCDVCPLGAKTIEKKINGRIRSFSIPNKCQLYKPDGGRCELSRKAYCDEMINYFEFGELDSRELHKQVVYSLLSAATLNRQVDLVTDGKVKFQTIDALDRAGRQLEALNKQQYGEITKNLNVNVNMTDAVVEAYQKRKKVDGDGGEENESGEKT